MLVQIVLPEDAQEDAERTAQMDEQLSVSTCQPGLGACGVAYREAAQFSA